MIRKISIVDYRPSMYIGWGWYDQKYRDIILLNKIEQIMADASKGILSYINTSYNNIISISIKEIIKILSVKRIWYGD